MKTPWKHALALTCALALALSLASCQKEEQPTSAQTNTLETSTQAPATQSPNTTLSQTTGASGTAATRGSQPSPTAKGGNTMNEAQLLALYNQGVTQLRSRTSFTRAMNSGKLWSPGNFDGASFDLMKEQNALSAFNTTDKAAKNADLGTLSQNDVASIQMKTTGNQRVLTLHLKSRAGGQALQKGAGGYAGLVDFNEGKTIAKNIGKALKFSAISVKDMQFVLQDGVITAVFPANGTTMQSATLSYTQKMDMDMKFIAFKIQGDITCRVEASYAK